MLKIRFWDVTLFLIFAACFLILLQTCSAHKAQQATVNDIHYDVEESKVNSAVVISIDPVDSDKLQQIVRWGEQRNQVIDLQENRIVFRNVGSKGMEAILTTDGVLTITGSPLIRKIGDLDDYRNALNYVHNVIRGGTGGIIPKDNADLYWYNKLTVYAPSAQIYKRIVVDDFDENYTLKIPNCKVFQGSLTITAGYQSGISERLRKPATFFIGVDTVLVMPALDKITTEQADITRNSFAGAWPVIYKRSPHAVPKKGSKMILEFLTAPCEDHFVLEDKNGNSLQDETRCKAIQQLDSLLRSSESPSH